MRWLRRLRYLFRQGREARDLAQEIEFHRGMLEDRRQMGNVTCAMEDARAVWIWPWLESIGRDIHFAIRGLRREPGFAAAALVTLGIAAGLNVSLFTLFNSIALRPWPVADPGRVVRIFTRNPRAAGQVDLSGVSIPEFRYLSEHSRALSGVVSLAQRRISFGFEPFGKRSKAILVAANHFEILGAGLHMGRGFLPEEDRSQAPAPVIALSYEVWRDHFGSDPAILGKRIPVDDVPFTVVGVGEPGFNLSGDADSAWVPLAAIQLLFPNDSSERDWLSSPQVCCDPIAGRLARGVTAEQARVELEILSRQFRSANAVTPAAVRFEVTPVNFLAGDRQRPEILRLFGVMFLGMTLIVLLACANLGNLLLARAAARRHEIEVRRAVGAGRIRLIRQLLTESLVLSLGAGGIAILLAYRVPTLALALMFDSDLPAIPLTPDRTVLVYVLGLSLLACIAFGLAPALHGTNPKPTANRMRMRNWLLAAQVALSVILLTGAGLMLEGVRRAARTSLGFQAGGLEVTKFDLPWAALNQAGIQAFTQHLQFALPGIIGLGNFSLVTRTPLENNWNTLYRLPQESRAQLRRTGYHEVSTGYFETLRIPIVAGRDFRTHDASHAMVVINQTLARRWENGNAVGKTIVIGGRIHEVIGIAKDAHTDQLDENGPALFVPLTNRDVPEVLFGSNGPGVGKAIEVLAARIQPGIRAQTMSLSKNLERRLGPSRTGAQIAGFMGLFALGLATVGIFGVFAYAVQQRRKEIGIRMALGAKAGHVIRAVLAGCCWPLAAGLAGGFAGAAAATQLIARYIHGVNPLDGRVYAIVVVILAAAAFAASYVPSRRAARTDPLAALRAG